MSVGVVILVVLDCVSVVVFGLLNGNDVLLIVSVKLLSENGLVNVIGLKCIVCRVYGKDMV